MNYKELSRIIDSSLYEDQLTKISRAKKATDIETLAELATDDMELVRLKVAENPNTPPEILEGLAHDEEVQVVVAVAENPNTPSEILVNLSKLKGRGRYSRYGGFTHYIYEALAENPNTPQDVLINLSHVESAYDLRRLLLKNPNLPTAALETLSTDRHYDVREGVANHPNTSADTLRQLAADDEASVSKAAASRL